MEVFYNRNGGAGQSKAGPFDIPAAEGYLGIKATSLSRQGGAMPARRTTHRSSKGTKLYAVRDSKGRFVDIQTYKRAHAADMRRKSQAETAKKPK
jgi:hypothetical protein